MIEEVQQTGPLGHVEEDASPADLRASAITCARSLSAPAARIAVLAGVGARSAFGVAGVPFDSPVEIDATFYIRRA